MALGASSSVVGQKQKSNFSFSEGIPTQEDNNKENENNFGANYFNSFFQGPSLRKLQPKIPVSETRVLFKKHPMKKCL